MFPRKPQRLLLLNKARLFPPRDPNKLLHLSPTPPPPLPPPPPPPLQASLPLHTSIYKHLLRRCADTRSLILGKLLHSHMIRTCYGPTLSVRNNLLAVYCKCGDMATACQLFDRMPVRDSVTWNSLMAGYSQMGSAGKALDVFRRARVSEVPLDRFSYAGALGACARSGDLRKGRILHGMVMVNGLYRGAFIANSLIDMYSKCGMIDDVRFVFDRADELDEVSWNSLLSAYVRMGWPEVATNILVWMHRSGVRLNSFALGGVLKACMGFDDCEEVRRMLHGCVIKIGLDLDLFVGSAMLDMYAKNGGLEEAIKVFECIPNPNVVVFNAMIAGFSRLGNEKNVEAKIEALRLFAEMLRRRMRPSKFTFKSVLEACNLTNSIRCGMQIHAHIILNGLQEDEFIGNALITLYSKSGLIDCSLRCFLLTPKDYSFTWTSIITAYIQNEQFERALHMFKEYLGQERKPDQFIISSVTNACSDLSITRAGEQIQGYAAKSGLDKFTVYGNAQINMYTKTGDIGASIKTFEEIDCWDIFSWSMMILSYGLHGYVREALKLFEKIEECQIVPDDMTFLAVLTACSHGGLADEGFRYYESMITDYDLSPSVKHKACIVDLLGRAGRLADAEGFITNSAFENDPLMWHALLRACYFHGDKERGIRIGERLMIIEPFASSSYMSLYNMYLDVEKISMAMRTRGLMRERGVAKEIGVSWIEIGPLVHTITAGNNNSYSIDDQVYSKLKEMMAKVEGKMGNVGLQIFEFKNQSEKWKENLMNSHGELMAVVLGMYNLPQSVTIIVMKNQRVCGDCHAILKLLSEVEGREIVIRDPCRFHWFNSGSCSCGNYW